MRLKKIADKYRKEFCELSDEDIISFSAVARGESFGTITEYVKRENKKLADSMPF